MNPIIDTGLPIIPDQGLGGIELRRNIEDYDRVLSEVLGDLDWGLNFPFHAAYTLRSYSIEISVDIRNGTVSRIAALDGYHGTLFGKIGVGMSVSEALELAPDFYYDEMETIFFSEIHDGVFLDIGADAPLDMVPSLAIEAIWVYAPEFEVPKSPPDGRVRWDVDGRPLRLGK